MISIHSNDFRSCRTNFVAVPSCPKKIPSEHRVFVNSLALLNYIILAPHSFHSVLIELRLNHFRINLNRNIIPHNPIFHVNQNGESLGNLIKNFHISLIAPERERYIYGLCIRIWKAISRKVFRSFPNSNSNKATITICFTSELKNEPARLFNVSTKHFYLSLTRWTHSHTHHGDAEVRNMCNEIE